MGRFANKKDYEKLKDDNDSLLNRVSMLENEFYDTVKKGVAEKMELMKEFIGKEYLITYIDGLLKDKDECFRMGSECAHYLSYIRQKKNHELRDLEHKCKVK